jgi:hypothetical protein
MNHLHHGDNLTVLNRPGFTGGQNSLDLHWFCSGLLRPILAIKEIGYGSDTQRRVQAGCGSHCAHWPAAGFVDSRLS